MNSSNFRTAVSALMPVLMLSFGGALASDISAEENDAINKHMERAHQSGGRPPLPAVSSASAPLVELNAFSEAERKSFANNQVVIGSLEKNGHKRVCAKIKIAAHPHTVWETVHEERKTDPDLAYSKVLETSGHSSTLEQKFQLVPVVGTAVCEMKNVEVPGQRIDYWLTKSDKFKALEGSWVLTGLKDGSTVLELSSYIDMGLPVPRNMQDLVTGKKLERRLQNIRKMAEETRAHSVATRKPEPGS